MKPVYIRWLDSRGVAESWHRESELDPIEPCTVETVGFLVREDETSYHIAPHVIFDTEDTQMCGDMIIPKCCVIDQWDIK